MTETTAATFNSAETRVLVAGATGGVGQLTVAQLIDQGYGVRVITRSPAKARQLFGDVVAVVEADIRQPDTLPAATAGITHIICATGTTAFPSPKWDIAFPADQANLPDFINWGRLLVDEEFRNRSTRNRPQQVDGEGVENLVAAAPAALQRFVFVSSIGIGRKDQLPFSLLNAFGVLDAKERGETAIIHSSLPYTIIRPGRLIDGPYTSLDLNTLIQAKTDGKLGVVMDTGDRLTGDASRIDVAAACVSALGIQAAENIICELVNQGERPEAVDWRELWQGVG